MRNLRRWCLFESDFCTLMFHSYYRNRPLALKHAAGCVLNALGLNRITRRIL